MNTAPLPSRRTFLRTSAFTAGAFSLTGCRTLFGRDEVRVAVIGMGGRGPALVKDVLRTEKARLVAICDVDSEVLAQKAKKIEEEHGLTVATVGDYRAVLDRRDIDAVVLATPNHWHALQTIWACEAGKDVYVEKPVSHSYWEGKQMVAAARKHRRIVQSGLQNRSDIGLTAAFPRILAGELGAIQRVRGLCYRNRTSIGKADTALQPPPTVDFEQWLGPAPEQTVYRPRFHYDWHWYWNTGNGDFGNQGPHELDLIHWILGEPQAPRSVVSFGNRFGWNDAGETPNMQVTRFDWDGTPVLFEVRNLWINPETNSAANYLGRRVGVIVTCEGGEFRGGRGGGFFYDHDGKKMAPFKGDGGYDHFPNFIRAVLSGRRQDLICEVEQGNKSADLVHLGNASQRIGEAVSDTSLRNAIANDEWLCEAHQRYLEHLKAWNLSPDALEWMLGPKLRFDRAKERFVGDHAALANPLLVHKGRAPFEIPQYA